MHWNYSGTKVGPWERFREIFDPTYRATLDEIVLPEHWPCAATWNTTYNRDGKVVNAWTGKCAAFWLAYDNATLTDFDVGETVTGGTSGATGVIVKHTATNSTSGKLYFQQISKPFVDNETITAPGASATANGASKTTHNEDLVGIITSGSYDANGFSD